LNLLEKLRIDAYESLRVYKKKMKKLHDKCILRQEFKERDLVLFFNSHLKLFPEKLRSRSFGPFEVLMIFPYETAKVWSETSRMFKVNGQQLKHYIIGDLIKEKMVYTFSIPSLGHTFHGQDQDFRRGLLER